MNFISFGIKQEHEYEVFIMVEVFNRKQKMQYFEFLTSWDAYLTIKAVQAGDQVQDVLSEQYNGDKFFEMISTFKKITSSYREKARLALQHLGEQTKFYGSNPEYPTNTGFVLRIDQNNPEKTKVWCSSWREINRYFNGEIAFPSELANDEDW